MAESDGQIFMLEPEGESPLQALVTTSKPGPDWQNDRLEPLTPERARQLIVELQEWLAAREGLG